MLLQFKESYVFGTLLESTEESTRVYRSLLGSAGEGKGKEGRRR